MGRIYRMTLSARASTSGEIVRPICFAAFKPHSLLFTPYRMILVARASTFGGIVRSIYLAALSWAPRPRRL